MGIISFILLGVIVGLIAKTMWKRDEPGGLLGALIVGVSGALLGGLIASAAGLGGLGSFFSLATWLIAIGGALVFLFLFDQVTSRSSRSHTATG